jgi:integrase
MPQLYDHNGNRLYLNSDERRAFLDAAAKEDRTIKCLCLTIAHTGCRISEALQTTAARIDLSDNHITFRSLKKRKDKQGAQRMIYRTVPIPEILADTLDMVYGIRETQQSNKGREMEKPLWDFSRVTAWAKVKQVMNAANIPDGVHKTAKGLRHSYGVHATINGVQLHMLKKWMGHADMKTTAIYADAIGEEERTIASRMWD